VGTLKLCPSARCTEGALLIGIRDTNGKVVFLGNPLTIEKSLADDLRHGRPPEIRFRFAQYCVQNRCQNREHNGCQVAARVISEDAVRLNAECGGIANGSRKMGSQACQVCSSIIRGVAPDD
jgi:hypothetical protein